MHDDAGASSLSRRVADVFFAPRRLFGELRLHPVWIGALALAVTAAVVVAAAVPAELLLERMREPVDRLGRPVEVTSDARTIVFWGRILQAFSALVMQPVIVLALAALFTLVFRGWLHGGAGYREHLSLVSHVSLIPALGAVLQVGVRLLREGDARPLSLALLVPSLRADDAVFRFLNVLDPFTLWAVAVAALGVSVLNPGRSWLSAAAILAVPLLVGAVAAAALPG